MQKVQMRSWRENPDGAENTRATKDAEREIRNLQKYELMKAMEWHPDLIGQIEVTDNMQTPNTMVLQVVSPGKDDAVGRSYKIIYGVADNKIYYYEYEKITNKYPAGFLRKDFERLAAN